LKTVLLILMAAAPAAPAAPAADPASAGPLPRAWEALREPEAAPAIDTVAAELSALLAAARETNPRILGARHERDAAAARATSAGVLPDPMLSLGLMNLPLGDMWISDDPMAMAALRLGQRFPAPGVRSAREAAALAAHDAARWRAEEVELEVVTRLKKSYYELYFIEEAVRVLGRNRALLEGLAENARVRFAVGEAPQQDVLRAQTEVTRLDEQLAGLRARREVALGDIGEIVQQPMSRRHAPALPESVRTLALADLPGSAFTAAALGEGMGNGFPPLEALQAEALDRHPGLRAEEHRVRQGEAELLLSRREQLPDVDVMLGYGRGGGTSRVSLELAVPLPVFAGRKQRQGVVVARAELAATRQDEAALQSELSARVASRYAEALRLREQIVLLADGVIPQARATLESADAAYRAGRVQFLGLLEAHATLFRTEIEAARAMADFGRALSELEGAIGRDLELEELR
jgi:outer membrane protein, heavy metal efflux system